MTKSTFFKIHPDHPEPYKISKVADALRDGAVILYPTDTVYAIGCDPRNKDALARLRAIKPLDSQHALTMLCPSLSDIATYAYVENDAFKLIKALTPGPYTFLLKATKEMPKLVLNPKRKTAGLRIPGHKICQSLLAELGSLLVSTSARLPSGDPVYSPFELFDGLSNLVDIIIDDDRALGLNPSTVIDLTGPEFEVVREGQGMQALRAFMR
jgi:tRNA threonylcarbamoyl adenosine modification protein (Sua5/YciO/YrdC/YwlC family)